MGLLDQLFNGGLPTQANLAPDPQEALLADLFRRLHSGGGQIVNTVGMESLQPQPTQPPPAQTGHMMPETPKPPPQPPRAPAQRFEGPSMQQRLADAFIGLGGGNVPNRAAETAQAEQRNATLDWLMRNNVDAETARAAAMNPEIMKHLITSRLGGGSVEYGKTGAIFQGADGKFYSVQFASNGQKKIEPLETGGGGLTPARGVMQVGDELVDKAHGGTVRNVGPQIAAKERAEELGTAQAKAQVSLPQVEAAAARMIKQLDELETDPSLESITGFVGGRIPEKYQTEAMARAQSRVNQVAGGVFLQAYNELRGAGQITEQEGAQARAAYARLGTQTMGTEDYRKALQEAREETLKLVELAKRKAGGGVSAPSSAPAQAGPRTGQTQSGIKWSLD